MPIQRTELLRVIGAFHPKTICDSQMEIHTIRMLSRRIQKLIPHCLYVGNAADLPLDPPPEGAAFLVTGDQIPPAYTLPGIHSTIISVDAETDRMDLFDAVQELSEKEIQLAAYLTRLLKIEKSSSSIQKILDMAYEVLKNPLLLVDVSLCFIAHAGGNTVSDEPLWEWTISKGYVTKEYVDYILNDTLEDEQRFIWEEGLLKHDQLVYRILSGGTPIGYLKVLSSNQPITALDQEIIAATGNCLAHFMQDDKIASSASTTLTDAFLLSLLNRKIYDKNAIDERVNRFNMKFYDKISLIAIRSENEFQGNNDLTHLFLKKLQNFLGRDTILYYNGHFVVVYDSKYPQPFNEAELLRFEAMLADYNCYAGISNVRAALYQLPEQYQEAVSALSSGRRLRIPGNITFYSDILLQHIFLEFSAQHDLDTLIHPAVRILMEADQERGSLFLDTVRVYIKHNMDIAPAAKAMFLHYNTMKYRLQKIVELTHIDFTESDTIFRVQLSFLILEIQEKLKQGEESAEPKK